MFKTYDSKIKEILSTHISNTNWKKVLEHHKEMIAIIQHERLIHLLVTIFVGSVMTTSSFIVIVTKQLELLIIALSLLVLFTAYLFHYRYLENTTQDWYLLEDKIKEKNIY
ncbi:MAG: hypothetical protein NTZ55_01110 [Candidatus Roizmanbacteria bacterium]|nr:hypothetical protein [Candidatus Roizmanbacteria bacterium]